MSLDVVILAGGLGTRLRGLWGGPKCLVPVGGRTILDRLLIDHVTPLHTRRVCLALGYRGAEVMLWCETGRAVPLDPVPYFSVENEALGTTGALRHAAELFDLRAPLLVLNGDTLPGYDLRALARFHESRVGCWATVAAVPDIARWRHVYAGACVLSAAALEAIVADRRTSDLTAHLFGANLYAVPGFLDVGTPEGFQLAKEWRDE